MKAILEGTFETGFSVVAVCAEAKPPEIGEDGRLIVTMAIDDPASLQSNWTDQGGARLLAFDAGLGNGFSIYGPFASDDAAEAFGEEHRGEGDEWEIFRLDKEVTTPERSTEILQHRIDWWLRGIGIPPAELGEASVEHIEKAIREGYVAGELCVGGEDAEYRGWWEKAK